MEGGAQKTEFSIMSVKTEMPELHLLGHWTDVPNLKLRRDLRVLKDNKTQ